MTGDPNDIFTTSRASGGYAEDANGNWSLFANNKLRWVKGARGYTEPGSSNSIRNNSMQGAVAGTAGTIPTNWQDGVGGSGLSRQIVGIGTENGIDYIDIRWFGTSSSASERYLHFEANNGIAALNAQVWTQSSFVSLVGGSLTNVTLKQAMYERDSGASAITGHVDTAFVPTSVLTRRSYTQTLSNALTAFLSTNIGVTVPNGTACDFTLRIGWPQMEQQAWASTPLRTTSAVVTRATDIVSITNMPALGAQFGAYTHAQSMQPTMSQTHYLLAESANNRLLYATAGTQTSAYNGTNILSTGGTGSPTWTVGSKAASGFAPSDRAASMSGGTQGTDTNIQTAPTALYLGTNGSASGPLKHREGAIFAVRPTNAQLQALTA